VKNYGVVILRRGGRGCIAAEVASPVDNFLMDVTDHDLQIEIIH
jgi:hypothetical protein